MGTAEGAEGPAAALGLPGPSAAEDQAEPAAPSDGLAPTLRQAIESAKALIAKAEGVLPSANAEDAVELQGMLADLRNAVQNQSEEQIRAAMREVEDLVFYLEDA